MGMQTFRIRKEYGAPGGQDISLERYRGFTLERERGGGRTFAWKGGRLDWHSREFGLALTIRPECICEISKQGNDRCKQSLSKINLIA